jgi:hypothetical protein
MSVNLAEFEPITELNKPEMVNWLTATLNILTDPNFDRDNPNFNRIFGTDRDDVDEVIDMFGRFTNTLINYSFIKK